MSLWRPNGGTNILVGTTGNPINCAECPCDEPIQTTCCDPPIRRRLLETITLKTGTCVCMPNSNELVYDDTIIDDHEWRSAVYGEGTCDNPDCFSRLICGLMSEEWNYGQASCAEVVTPVSAQCDPLELVFDVTNLGIGTNCAGTYRVTITDIP